MEDILGYFIFIAMGDDVLAAKFSHTGIFVALSESMTLLNGRSPTDPFIGQFAGAWLDGINQGQVASTQGFLHIRPKQRSQVNQYWLDWSLTEGGPPIYWGEGMVYNNTLFGSYWGGNVNNRLPNHR